MLTIKGCIAYQAMNTENRYISLVLIKLFFFSKDPQKD